MIDAAPTTSSPIPQMKQPQPQSSGSRRWLWLIGVTLLCLIAVFGLIQLAQKTTLSQLQEQLGWNFLTQQHTGNPALFRVGEETLYQSDLDFEKSAYPTAVTADVEAALSEKIQEDSIILQESAKKGLIVLDASIYNDPDKDYQKRLDQVAVAKTGLFANELTAKQGEGVAIWFMNTVPAPMGYEAGKKLALEKITALHQQVVAGEMTMKDAGEQIASDTSLERVDPAYKSNAYFSFVVVPEKQVVFDKAADAIIRATEPGAVTDILTLVDRAENDPALKDAVYMFAKIAPDQGADPALLTHWLDTLKSTYAITPA